MGLEPSTGVDKRLKNILELTNKDKIILDFEGDIWALDLETVDSIVEVERFFPIPHSPIFLNGVISLHGEVITVINLPVLFEVTRKSEGLPYRVIISKMNGTYMGFYIGKASTSFLWKKAIEKMRLIKEKKRFTMGVIESDDIVIRVINWDSLLNYTMDTLSKEY
jgi:purine-binding chemotaxis protein CheW